MTGRVWAAMTPAEFTTDPVPDQPLTLMPAPDPCGTPGLFTLED